ncbi:MAG: molybdopterin containing oxidoreductase [Acidobacteria bacterium]|nr:molybdopterin containing oxidoreductase [Acidobacteriota bacterium]
MSWRRTREDCVVEPSGTLSKGAGVSKRRRFLKILGSAIGLSSVIAPVWRKDPTKLIPEVLAAQNAPFAIEGKEDLTILNDRPINAETPLAFLDDEITSNAHHFIRNNGLVPERARNQDANGWSLTVDGEVERPLELTLDQLKSRYPNRREALVLECGGNGRAGFYPPASGNQWTLGAVGCALYTGVRLMDVLEDAGLKSTAVYLAYYGEDAHLSGDSDTAVISRGVPIAKALDDHTLLAWAMNDEPLPAQHGFPLRLVAPGFPASVSGKWLRRLWVRDRVHDGSKMTGYSYRIPKYPVSPGTEVLEADMVIIEAMPVKSVITHPVTGISHTVKTPLSLRGHAWCGEGPVEAMHLSVDFGATWVPALLAEPRNRFAWQRWKASVSFPTPGHYEVWARATDHQFRMQPMIAPGWNPRGYLNNAMHRIAVSVT